MALHDIRRNNAPTDDMRARRAVMAAQQAVRAQERFLADLDRIIARSPGGKDALLDAVADLGSGGDVIDEFSDVISKALAMRNAHKEPAADDRTLPVTASDVAQAKTRRGV